MDKINFFILNVFVNSFLAFLTVAFLIECIAFLFRIPQGRIKATLRLIPIIKLPLDLFLYDFTSWSFIKGINPIFCEEGSRHLSLFFGSVVYIKDWLVLPLKSGILMTTAENLTFTVADVIGYSMHPNLLKVFSISFLILTTIIIFRKINRYFQAFSALKMIKENDYPSDFKIKNPTLKYLIKKHKVKIFTFDDITNVPFVVGLFSPIIYIPEHLTKNLSEDEYEAILAHELSHIQHKDSLQRLILDLIRTVFWWLPTYWLYQLIVEGQEIGCDLQCETHAIDPTTLASAIFKSAKLISTPPQNLLETHFSKNITLKRVQILLNDKTTKFKKIRLIASYISVLICFCAVLTGKFWLF